MKLKSNFAAMERQCRGEGRVGGERGRRERESRQEEEEDEKAKFFPRSLEIYLPIAYAEYECYKAFKTFWIQRAPDRLPTYTPLPDVLSLLKRHGIVCDSMKLLEIPQPRHLLSLEDVMKSHGSQFI